MRKEDRQLKAVLAPSRALSQPYFPPFYSPSLFPSSSSSLLLAWMASCLKSLPSNLIACIASTMAGSISWVENGRQIGAGMEERKAEVK